MTLLEQIIERNIDKLFLSYDVICAHPYRIMRNADLSIDEDEAEDLLVEIQKQLKKRQWGEAIPPGGGREDRQAAAEDPEQRAGYQGGSSVSHQRSSGSDLFDENVWHGGF